MDEPTATSAHSAKDIVISGSSGLMGQALTKFFQSQGHRVIPLLRNNSGAPWTWQPETGAIHWPEQEAVDAVINLAGESIAEGRWNAAKKRRIIESRVNVTQLLSKTMAGLTTKPEVFISASAIGFYGDTGTTLVDELTPQGTGYLSEVATQWEAATAIAKEAGIRTAITRFGVILSEDGGALKPMLLPFKLGLGGRIGNGSQFFSWISIVDAVKAIDHLITQQHLNGPFNLVSPKPITNREFTATLAEVLHRPAILPLPAMMARLLFGEMADHLLLASVKVNPTRLLESGFHFEHSQLRKCFEHLLS